MSGGETQLAQLQTTVDRLLSRVRALELAARPKPRDGGPFLEEDDQ